MKVNTMAGAPLHGEQVANLCSPPTPRVLAADGSTTQQGNKVNIRITMA